MADDALVLREVSESVWLDFASRPDASTTTANASSRWPVLSHWRRARALGARLEGPAPEDHLVRGPALRAHAERTEHIEHLARGPLEQAAGDVSPRDYLLVLADPTGVVVRTSGGGRFADDARRVRLIAGATWDEASRRTNAIGTAIAERRPVFVRGSAHLARRFHELVCYAAPIFDADGTLCAVLDATSAFERADDGVGASVVRAAQTITLALRAHAFGRAGAAVTRTLARALERMDGAALLVEAPGRVTKMSPGARVLFGERAGLDVTQLLGASMATLTDEAHHPSGATATIGRASYDVRVEPIETEGGAVIALLVLLDAKARTSRRSGATTMTTPAQAPSPFASVFTEDAALKSALTWAGRVADSTVPVLLLAETGSGKELVARAIAAASSRRDGPFVAVNCGSIAPSLLESELFGYGPSAFTGAEKSGRQGLFSVASGGTIFLDEVAEMPPAMQAALLRVLEDGTYRRVGETTPMRADVRVISATCRDLPAMVAAGTFRRDLYYRLKGAEVRLPPLRERSDLAALARHLVAELATARSIVPAPALSDRTLAILRRHPWPGNVRELRSILEVALILVGKERTIEPEHLPPELGALEREDEIPLEGADAEGSAPDPTSAELSIAERSAVRRVLGEVQGNVSRAAKRLGVARSTLYRLMKKHGLLDP